MERSSGELSPLEQTRIVTALGLFHELPFACNLAKEQDYWCIEQQGPPASAPTNKISLQGIETASEAMSAYETLQNEDIFTRCTEATGPTDVVPSTSGGEKAEDGDDAVLKSSTRATHADGSSCRTMNSSPSNSTRDSSPGPKPHALCAAPDQFAWTPPRETELDLGIDPAASSVESTNSDPDGLTLRDILGRDLDDIPDILQTVDDLQGD